MTKHLHMSAKGRVRWAVVDAATQQVVREASDWNRNLILNQGMDSIASRTWVGNFTYCVVGTGVTPTSDQSGATTVSQNGTALTLTGGTFTLSSPGDVGKVIKWATGQTAQISAVTSGTTAVATNSATIADAQFTLYRTNQVGLASEVQRTSNYLTSAGACGTTIVGGVLQHRRTFDFPVENGTVNYTEVGFSWTNQGGNNLFSRILFDAPVQVNSGQQLRIVYELHVTPQPQSPVSKTAIISGWPVAPSGGTTGQEILQNISLTAVNTNGSEIAYNGIQSCNEPAVGNGYPYYAFLSSDARALSAWNTNNGRGYDAAHPLSIAAYIAGSYQVQKSATFAVGEANQSNFRAMGYGLHIPGNGFYASSNGAGYVFLFDEAQTKTNTYTLTLTWLFTWSRDFS